MRAPSAFFILALGPVLSSTALARPSPVEHTIDLRRAREQVVTVTVRVADLAADEHGNHSAVLRMPVWRPGMYSVLDQAGSIRTVVARNMPPAELDDPAIKTYPVAKVDKSSWRVETGADEAVYVTYELIANSLDNRSRHADDTHAFLDPAAILMYTDETRGLAQKVRILAPTPPTAAWRVASGLIGDEGIPGKGDFATLNLKTAPDYDRLADSPIEAGIHHTMSFDVDGVPHDVVIWTGEPTLEDSAFRRFAQSAKGHWDDLPKDLEKIVRAESALFGGKLPYDRYLFIIHASPVGRGGTEHYNSCVMQTSPDFLSDGDAYRRFLGLAAHEFFHTWNVKRFRPAELTPYDYQRENLTTLLWVAEGATTYYDAVLLARAGLAGHSRRQYLDRLASDIRAHDAKLGSGVQPVADSSYDAWIKFNKKSADSANSTVSFYDKGALVSFVLDMLIRKANPGASLDDVMRGLYARFPEPTKGYTEADLRGQVAAAAGCAPDADWLAAFFRNVVHGVARPDFEAALAVVGYELRPGDPRPKPYAGFTLTDEAGVAKVSAVASDSPALKADPGLLVGDVVVALDRRRLTAGALDRELARRSPGDAVTLTLFRNDILRDLTFTLADKPEPRLTIRRVENPTDEQDKQADRWLGPESR